MANTMSLVKGESNLVELQDHRPILMALIYKQQVMHWEKFTEKSC
jgi:hypothetical protein